MEAAEKNKVIRIVKKTLVLLSFFVLFFTVSAAQAATLYFSPSSGSKPIGKNFSVSVFVSSADQAMNAASGDINVSSNLQVVSVSKSGSIFSLWAQEPAFSASGLSFEGIVLNPGYKGAGGKIVTFTLKPTEAGQASVGFSGASVLANDGNGTNILNGSGSASFVIADTTAPMPTEEQPTPPISTVPGAPKVTSANCPGPDGWCVGNDPKFLWNLPAGTTGVSILGDHNPGTDPGTKSDGIMSSYTYTNVEEGQWYFHIRLRNANGWGPVTHYKFQIDTQKPESFNLSLAEPVSAFDAPAKLRMEATDAGSGIGTYEIAIDSDKPEIWVDDGSHIFQTKALFGGKRTITAKAMDKAGNFLTSSVEFIIDSMEPPILTEYPDKLAAGQTLVIKGKSYNNAKIVFFVQKEGSEPINEINQIANTDSSGDFRFVYSGKLSEGTYMVWAVVENSARTASAPSEIVTIAVSQRAFLAIGSLLISYLSVLITLIALVALLVGLLWYSWHKLSVFKNKIRKEVETVEKTIHVAFDGLREGTRKQVSTLERVKLKRELTKEEGRILTQLKNQLSAAENFIKKEVEKIEKDIK